MIPAGVEAPCFKVVVYPVVVGGGIITCWYARFYRFIVIDSQRLESIAFRRYQVVTPVDDLKMKESRLLAWH